LGQGARRVLRLVAGRRQRVHHGYHRRACLPGIRGLGRGVGVPVRLDPNPVGLGAKLHTRRRQPHRAHRRLSGGPYGHPVHGFYRAPSPHRRVLPIQPGAEPVDVLPGLFRYVRWTGPGRLAHGHDFVEPLVRAAPGTGHGTGHGWHGYWHFGPSAGHRLVGRSRCRPAGLEADLGDTVGGFAGLGDSAAQGGPEQAGGCRPTPRRRTTGCGRIGKRRLRA